MKHLISRQVDRRELFKAALVQMPYDAVWETEERSGTVTIDGVTGKRLRTGNFKAIPRRQRRSMARDLSKRQYRNARVPGLCT